MKPKPGELGNFRVIFTLKRGNFYWGKENVETLAWQTTDPNPT